jgi:iron only hydrogenase large subunit-like protein
VETTYPELIPHLSSCRSPQGMLSAVIKTYWANKNNIDPKDIIIVSFMPCTAKKDEAKRPQLDGHTDYVLTTRELIRLMKIDRIHLPKIKEIEFDNPLGESTGAAHL